MAFYSIAEAAAVLGCHTRTVERRLKSGTLRSTIDGDGHRQVIIDEPESDTDARQGSGADPIAAMTQLQERALSAFAATATSARQDTVSARRGTLALAACLALVICGGAWLLVEYGRQGGTLTATEGQLTEAHRQADIAVQEHRLTATTLSEEQRRADVLESENTGLKATLETTKITFRQELAEERERSDSARQRIEELERQAVEELERRTEPPPTIASVLRNFLQQIPEPEADDDSGEEESP